MLPLVPPQQTTSHLRLLPHHNSSIFPPLSAVNSWIFCVLILSKNSNAVHIFLLSLVCLLLTFCTIRFLLTVLVTTLHVPSFCTVTACTPAPLSTSRINHYYQTSCSDSVLAHSLIHSFLPSFFFLLLLSFYLPFRFTCLSLFHLHSLSSCIPDRWFLPPPQQSPPPPPPPFNQATTCNITNYRSMVPLLSSLPYALH